MKKILFLLTTCLLGSVIILKSQTIGGDNYLVKGKSFQQSVNIKGVPYSKTYWKVGSDDLTSSYLEFYGSVDGDSRNLVMMAKFEPTKKFQVTDHLDIGKDITLGGDINFSNTGGYLFKTRGIAFTWNSTYGTVNHIKYHGITSQDNGGSYSDDITFNSFGNIRVNFDSNNNGTNHYAIGSNSTTNGNTYFYIKDGGNIGIGTTTPGAKLEVASPSTGATILLGRKSGNPSIKSSTPWLILESNGSAISLNHYSSNNVFLAVGGGKIGLGTTSPEAKLHVNGNIKIGRQGIGGTYSSSQVQGIWSIAPNYTINTSANDFGTQYGIVYGYQSIGSANNTKKPMPSGWGHQILYVNNGTRNAAISMSYGHAYFRGDVCIGTINSSGYKLSVKGKIRADEVKVYTSWADYVFAPHYDLKTIEEVNTFIEENKHLPDVPTESEVLENGVELGEMNKILLQKIEELTLYVIELNEKNKQLEERINKMEE